MSKFYARSYMYERGLDKYDFRKVYSQLQPKIRYLSKTQEFHFKTFDVISYLRWNEIEYTDFKIHESIITRFLKFDKFYGDTPLDDITSSEVKKIETDSLEDFYDDVYINLCFFQLYYFFSKEILKLIKRQLHIYRLNRADDMWFYPGLIPINRNGGRIPGGKFSEPIYLSKEEKEILLDNLSRYDRIIAKYAASEVSLNKFVYMHKQLAKLGTLLPEKFQKPFMRREEGLTWYWHAIRYNYKKEHGGILDPSLEEILKMQEKHGFPWTPC